MHYHLHCKEIDLECVLTLTEWLSNHNKIPLNNEIIITPILSYDFLQRTIDDLQTTKTGNNTNHLKHIIVREHLLSNYEI